MRLNSSYDVQGAVQLFACLIGQSWTSSSAPHPLRAQPAVSVRASGCACANSAPLAPPPSGPQWFRTSGIPRDVTPGWRYASLNRSYCNLFSVQRAFFRETASHFLHLFGKLKTPDVHAEDGARASAALLYLFILVTFLLLFLMQQLVFVVRFILSVWMFFFS